MEKERVQRKLLKDRVIPRNLRRTYEGIKDLDFDRDRMAWRNPMNNNHLVAPMRMFDANHPNHPIVLPFVSVRMRYSNYPNHPNHPFVPTDAHHLNRVDNYPAVPVRMANIYPSNPVRCSCGSSEDENARCFPTDAYHPNCVNNYPTAPNVPARMADIYPFDPMNNHVVIPTAPVRMRMHDVNHSSPTQINQHVVLVTIFADVQDDFNCVVSHVDVGVLATVQDYADDGDETELGLSLHL
ncbi:hypothetical protein J5N97_028353 [Dioscorea zingiberensis]|uniref:Uncharacterized protein n=1 Tax=Dioscorea zingiberensis TaxID=325984 RepID=A0A9D5BYF3_9LILI|nr:hypothetical protein J5N97_028353 [Dioscorea zingiberensis]